MASKKEPKRKGKVDVEAVLNLYREGRLTIAQIAETAGGGCSVSYVKKLADKHGVTRDISSKVAHAVRAKMAESETDHVTIVDGPEKDKPNVTGPVALARGEVEVIEAAAAQAVHVLKEHRKDIRQARDILRQLFSDMESGIANNEQIAGALQELEERDYFLAREVKKAISISHKANVLVNLTNSLKTLVQLERQVFGILDNEGAGDNETYEDKLRKIMEKPID